MVITDDMYDTIHQMSNITCESLLKANPAAEIIMKPTKIMASLCTKTSSALPFKDARCRQHCKPTSPPKIIEPEYNCATKVKLIASKSHKHGSLEI